MSEEIEVQEAVKEFEEAVEELAEEAVDEACEEAVEEEVSAAPDKPQFPGSVRKLAYRFNEIKEDIAKICEGCGRDPKEITIIALSKTLVSREVLEAVYAGIHDFAENRPEVIEEKSRVFFKENWHYVGRIQTKKIRHIAGYANVIDSVYDVKHLNLIIQRDMYSQIEQKMYLQINSARDEQKQGVFAERTSSVIAPLTNYPHLRLIGLSCEPIEGTDEEKREAYRKVAELRDELNEKWIERSSNVNLEHLSMGRDDDYAIAIEEGSTEIILDKALFNDEFIAKWREERGIEVDESQFEDIEPEDEEETVEEVEEAEEATTEETDSKEKEE